MDPILAAFLAFALTCVIALVAITYRQKDIAALALKVLGQLPKKDPTKEQDKMIQE